MKVTDYKVLLGDTVKELQGEIRLYLEKGWKLQGGVSISISIDASIIVTALSQAMIKEEECE